MNFTTTALAAGTLMTIWSSHYYICFLVYGNLSNLCHFWRSNGWSIRTYP